MSTRGRRGAKRKEETVAAPAESTAPTTSSRRKKAKTEDEPAITKKEKDVDMKDASSEEEEEEVDRTPEEVVELLKKSDAFDGFDNAKKFWYLPNEPPMYVNFVKSEGLALLSAVQRDDYAQAKKILEATRIIVAADGKKANSNITAFDPEDFHYEVTFQLPSFKKLNVVFIALLRSNIEMADLLWTYFNPYVKGRSGTTQKFLLQRPEFTNHEYGQLGTLPLSAKSFEWLLSNLRSKFVAAIPNLAVESLLHGQPLTTRRCLRYLLDMEYFDLNATRKLIKRTSSINAALTIVKERHGLTPLHLAALEATSPKELPEPLNEDTTNAPSLGAFITPVHLAAANPNVEILKVLVEKGGDVTLESDGGWYALSFAAAAPPAKISLAKLREGTKKVKEAEKKRQEAERKRKEEEEKKRQEELKRKEEEEEARSGRKRKAKAKKVEEVIPSGRVLRARSRASARFDDEGDEEVEVAEDKEYGVLDTFVRPAPTLQYLYEEAPNAAHDLRFYITTKQILGIAVSARRHHNIAYLVYYDKKCYSRNSERDILRSTSSLGDFITYSIVMKRDEFHSKLYNNKSEIDDILHEAIANQRTELFEAICDSDIGTTPDEVTLETAIKANAFSIVKLLVEKYKVPINSDAVVWSPLHKAVEANCLELVEYFIAKGSDINRLSNNVSVLMHAASGGKIECVKLLLKSGVSLNKLLPEKPKDEDTEMTDEKSEEKAPFENWHIVLSGIFSVSKDVIKQVVEQNGGKVTQVVNGKTTHCCYSGRDGVTDYGQPMGKGDSKYKEAKRRKLPFIDEATILRHLKRNQNAILAREGISDTDAIDEKQTILHYILKNSSTDNLLDVVKFLVDNGADVNAVDRIGAAPLHYVIEYRPNTAANADLLDYFISKGKENSVNWELHGYTPLLSAARHSKWLFVERLLSNPAIDIFATVKPKTAEGEALEGADNEQAAAAPKAPVDPNVGKPILEFLLDSFTSGAIIKKLITTAFEKGADPNGKKKGADSPYLISFASHPEVARLLLSHPKIEPNCTNNKGFTLLHALLTGGVDDFAQSTNTNSSAFGYNYGYNNNNSRDPIQELDNLFKSCPSLDPAAKDNYGRTPLHYAAGQLSTTSCIRFLLSRPGVNIDEQDIDGNTPLGVAIIKKNTPAAIYLIDAGADFNLPIFTSTLVDNKRELVQSSTYKFSMENNLESLNYILLNSPKSNKNEILAAAIATGKLNHAEQLIEQVGVEKSQALMLLQLMFKSAAFKSASSVIEDNFFTLTDKLFPLVNPTDVDADGYTILHIAYSQGLSVSIITRLLNFYSEKLLDILEVPNKRKQTICHTIVIQNKIDLLRQLYSTISKTFKTNKDAEGRWLKVINAQDDDGETLLHLALKTNPLGSYCDTSLVSLLTSYGLDPGIRNKKNISAAVIMGSLPPTYLESMKLALSGATEDTNITPRKLSDETIKEIQRAQEERTKKINAFNEKIAQKIKQRQATIADFSKKIESMRKNRETSVLDEKNEKVQAEKAKKGLLKVVVDPSFSNSNMYNVYISPAGDVYDAALSDTDINASVFGRNQFYSVQLVELKPESNKQRLQNLKRAFNFYEFVAPKYQVIERWGRVGEMGKTKAWPFNNLEAAKKKFETIFLNKTDNEWSERSSFKYTKGYFNYVMKFYEDVIVETPETIAAEAADKAASKLSPTVLLFLRAITSLSEVRKELAMYGYDVNTAPLGSLGRKTIVEGWKILSEIASLLEELKKLANYRGKRGRELSGERNQINSRITELSNKFYMTVPHDFGNIDNGFVKPDIINSQSVLQQKINLLQSMDDIETSLNLLMGDPKKGKSSSPNLLTQVKKMELLHSNLPVDLKALDKTNPRYQLIEEYVRNGGGTNPIARILKVTRWQDSVRFAPFLKQRTERTASGRPHNLLLWHGSKISNILGILLSGLKIAPPEAPTTGWMFGKGVYFADVIAKSMNYTSARSHHYVGYGYGYRAPKASDSDSIDNLSVVLLCEVAVGESFQCTEAEDFTEPPSGYQSVQGCGRNVPTPSGTFITSKGVGIPLGKLENSTQNFGLNYNEFIVYDESRIKIKYAVLFKN